ncbi:hypothetical protein ACIBI9_54065 [Nonomuraea sp. NPDC050451]|uniref:hypothetical protein n=1 Tax=Nonomuraea sp. NPDC050451 TaxID=3364364 RepID=UPI0037A597C5
MPPKPGNLIAESRKVLSDLIPELGDVGLYLGDFGRCGLAGVTAGRARFECPHA